MICHRRSALGFKRIERGGGWFDGKDEDDPLLGILHIWPAAENHPDRTIRRQASLADEGKLLLEAIGADVGRKIESRELGKRRQRIDRFPHHEADLGQRRLGRGVIRDGGGAAQRE